MPAEVDGTVAGHRRGKSVVVVVVVAAVAALIGWGAAVKLRPADVPVLVSPSASAVTGAATYTNVDDMLANNPFFIAHRGGSAQWPEMSMTAYANAARWGTGALEVSVARTKDGVYFGLHDKTLDRTSQVAGNIDPTTLTWAELTANYRNKLNAASPEGESYAQVSEIFAKFASDHVIFVDAKYIGDAQQRAELVDQMLAAAPADHWVLKGYYDNASLTTLARDEGIATWGYYYARDLGNLNSTAKNWDMLGLELGASDADWMSVTAVGKPVIAFFISDSQTLSQATSKGAQGMMVSDVPTTFGEPKMSGG